MRLGCAADKIGRICGAILGAGAVIAAAALQAEAEDLKIRSPIIEPHELEFENNFVFGHSKTAVHELEYGFTDWLKLGVEAELAADPGHGFRYDSAALKGFLQMTAHSMYWSDFELFCDSERIVMR